MLGGVNYNKMSTDHLLLTIVIIFTFLGVMLPFAQSSVNDNSSDYGYDVLNGKLSNDSSSVVVIITVFISVLKMFTFTFGQLPVWLDLILFMPLRAMAYIIIGTKIRG